MASWEKAAGRHFAFVAGSAKMPRCRDIQLECQLLVDGRQVVRQDGQS